MRLVLFDIDGTLLLVQVRARRWPVPGSGADTWVGPYAMCGMDGVVDSVDLV